MKIFKKVFLLTIVAASFLANAATSYPIADTTIVQNSPAESRYGWTFMTVSQGTQGVVTFSLEGVLPTGATANDVRHARLALDIPTIQNGGMLDVTLIQGTFTEASAPTWSTRSAMVPGNGSVITFALKQPLTVHYADVTSLVKKALTSNLKEFTVAISPSTSSPTASALIWARESALATAPWTPSQAARLSIDLGASASATPTYFWATTTPSNSCQYVCSSAGAIAVANSQGGVCKGSNGYESGTQSYGTIPASGGTLFTGNLCGGSPLTQCNCMTK